VPVFERIRNASITVLGIVLCLFTIFEVNFPQLRPQSALAVFVMLGMVICFLTYPVHPRFKDNTLVRIADLVPAVLTIVCCGYVIIQIEPAFKSVWSLGQSLGERAGDETNTDFVIGFIGVVLVLEATRRSIGWIVPALALAFMLHSYYCYGSQNYDWAQLPNWLLPHSGQNLNDISSTTFLQNLGVFGKAAGVMFKYVFLFVVFGAFLEMSGATEFIINFSERVFGGSPGGPAKVSVLGSGLMGSLSGSAVANAVTTGSFTIPMMRNAGFAPHIAGGITAAAASGGALVPPVMGAGAYMMLELVEPQVTFLQIAKAAVIPAMLYYLSIFLIVHFYSRRVGAGTSTSDDKTQDSLWQFEALVFFGAVSALVGLLLLKFSPFRAVTGSLILILVLSALRKKLQLGTMPRILALVSFALVLFGHQWFFAETVDDPTGSQIFESWLGSAIWGMFGLLIFGLIHPVWRPSIVDAFTKSAKNGISLVAASACVGIIIGIVQQTGIANDFSSVIKGVVETNLFLALVGIMACSIVLGMGVPSVVCYLLMATLMGSLLSELGVIPLAAHLFIFYFGMMSMVTPPVALAAYASASIAGARIMPTAFAAFRFSLVGFTLPFMFIYRPALLLMEKVESEAGVVSSRDLNLLAMADLLPFALQITVAVVGIIGLAAGIAGFLFSKLKLDVRIGILIAAALMLSPDVSIGGNQIGLYTNIGGGILFAVTVAVNWMRSRKESVSQTVEESSG
jgi:TRAP transporter 4TM/12TM fusion protein